MTYLLAFAEMICLSASPAAAEVGDDVPTMNLEKFLWRNSTAGVDPLVRMASTSMQLS